MKEWTAEQIIEGIKTADVDELAEIKATQRLHSWMLATNTVLLLAVLGKVLLLH